MITFIALYAFFGLVMLGIYLFPPTKHGQANQVGMFSYFRGRRLWMCFLICLACLGWPLVIAYCWMDDLGKFEWYD